MHSLGLAAGQYLEDALAAAPIEPPPRKPGRFKVAIVDQIDEACNWLTLM